MVEQESHDSGVSLGCGVHNRRIARLILVVGGHACFEEQVDGLGLSVLGAGQKCVLIVGEL
jgi:hypothetical protein